MARGKRSGRGPDYEWSGQGFSQLALAAGGSAQDALVGTTTPGTLVRTRGQIMVMLDGGAVAGDFVAVGWGLIIAPTGTTGLGSIPLTDPDGNFFGYGLCIVGTEGTQEDQQSGNFRFDVDVKAMRKMKKDESVFVVVETADVQGAPAVNIVGHFRFLLAH